MKCSARIYAARDENTLPCLAESKIKIQLVDDRFRCSGIVRDKNFTFVKCLRIKNSNFLF